MRKFWTKNRRNIATICAIIGASCSVIGLSLNILQTKPNDCPTQPAIEQQLDVGEKTQLELPDSN